MNAVQVVGDRDTVLAFALGGIPGRVVHTPAEALAAVRAVVDAVEHDGGPQRAPTLILVTHRAAAMIDEYLSEIVLDARAPLVLEIPGFGEAPEARRTQRFVERVLGIHS